MTEPAWLVAARKLVGLKEIVGSRHEPQVVGFFAAAGNAGVKDDETAWCAAFVGAMLAKVGIKGTGKLNARSYLDWGTKLTKPEVGCITVFQRGGSTWQGHVAFYLRTVGNQIEVLGGNQGNAVSIARYPAANLLGYRWPNAAATPAPVPKPPMEAEAPTVDVPAPPRPAPIPDAPPPRPPFTPTRAPEDNGDLTFPPEPKANRGKIIAVLTVIAIIVAAVALTFFGASK